MKVDLEVHSGISSHHLKIKTMQMSNTHYMLLLSVVVAACSPKPVNVVDVDTYPAIYPDYIGVTVPSTIAPLNFVMEDSDVSYVDVVAQGVDGSEIHANGHVVQFDIDEWHAMLGANAGESIEVTVSAKHAGGWRRYKPFAILVSKDTLDAYGLTYRRIAPGYEVYGQMGIYQRDLSSFDEEAVFDNSEASGACVNCHTGNRTGADAFVFHVRGDNGGTLLNRNGDIKMLNTKTEHTIGSLVYPYWHPDGRYIAFSTNVTRQAFHQVSDLRLEVFDNESDVVVFDTEKCSLVISPLLNGTKERLETFPVYSHDGAYLYFCSALPKSIPAELDKVRYELFKIGFNANDGSYGEAVDTVLSLAREGLSIVHPRPSYDGRYLMFTTCDYGTFPIWHKEADLWILDLSNGETRRLDEVNSDDSDSYHNWSRDSHWFVFTSRREDGLYTRLYLANIDSEGNVSKPFLLPQKSPRDYYDNLLYSYNTPDFVADKIQFNAKDVARRIDSGSRTSVRVDK